MTQAETTQWYENYQEGYRNGHMDRLLGYRSVVAWTSSLSGYNQGYQRAQEEDPNALAIWRRGGKKGDGNELGSP